MVNPLVLPRIFNYVISLPFSRYICDKNSFISNDKIDKTTHYISGEYSLPSSHFGDEGKEKYIVTFTNFFVASSPKRLGDYKLWE